MGPCRGSPGTSGPAASRGGREPGRLPPRAAFPSPRAQVRPLAGGPESEARLPPPGPGARRGPTAGTGGARRGPRLADPCAVLCWESSWFSVTVDVRHPAATWLLLNGLRHRTSVRLVFGGSRASGAPRPLYFDVVSGASTAFASPTLPGSRDEAWARARPVLGLAAPSPGGTEGPVRAGAGPRLEAGSGRAAGQTGVQPCPVPGLCAPSQSRQG